MPLPNGAWTQEEADGGEHIFSYRLAQWVAGFLPKEKPVIDLGCGKATYLRYLHDVGFEDLIGVEGFELNNFEFGNVHLGDLSEVIDMGKKGNVLCLEVAEHIPPESEKAIIENMTSHVARGCFLIMSWGIPGQEGLGHVNCVENSYAIEQITKRGLIFQMEETMQARAVIENHCSWFSNTIMIFKRP